MDRLRGVHNNLPWWYGHEPFIFPTRDAAAAYVITAVGRRYLKNCGRNRRQPLETWVIAPQPEQDKKSPLAAWFAAGPSTDNFRVILQNGRNLGTSPLRRASELLPIKSQIRKYAFLKPKTIPFLKEVLRAYQEGAEKVEAVVKRTGHPYSVSQAMPPTSNE